MVKYDINKILDFNFQMHLYSNKELCDISFFMFQYANLHNQNNIDDQYLKNLIEKLCLNYNIIPYHNWTHAFQLMHMYFCTYFNSQLKNFLEPFEFLVGLISGLAHDINHKGFNNIYKIKRKSENSLRYAEQGVLENMHISQFFRIIFNNPELDISQKITEPVFFFSNYILLQYIKKEQTKQIQKINIFQYYKY
ncbi:hypothetical protein IMG5_129820 [Ichthyophthirius multifiliis]|uniref:PDEase domain-containing protein n=1 Tax=Ichthyophthirius multifiliis TaxID=5932 RepID=G0QW74_ICHMU|nr:hypothetical protein IMG5_129820 [Ichthyophthirius multifiliis]EGR30529.1 hypothetical protein IMG5_129820 [Ichthyophthirius multifiliis]|eukprot:XP_004032116.1 hypothetical protein IMG5_129820 [Ichthyophthirius multifiliis]